MKISSSPSFSENRPLEEPLVAKEAVYDSWPFGPCELLRVWPPVLRAVTSKNTLGWSHEFAGVVRMAVWWLRNTLLFTPWAQWPLRSHRSPGKSGQCWQARRWAIAKEESRVGWSRNHFRLDTETNRNYSNMVMGLVPSQAFATLPNTPVLKPFSLALGRVHSSA